MSKKYYEVVFTKVESVFVEVDEQELEESEFDIDEVIRDFAEFEISDTDLVETSTVTELTSEYEVCSTRRYANHVSLVEER